MIFRLADLGRVAAHPWRLLAAGLTVVSLAGAAMVVHDVRVDRLAAIEAEAATATAAVAEARLADAMTWAPDELRVAERQFRDAQLARRLEDARLWPLPDAVRVTAAYRQAGAAAVQALDAARDRHASAAETTTAILGRAGDAIEASARLALAIHLDDYRRALLARARLTLAEARVFEREGDLGRAAIQARQAGDLAAQVRSHAAAVAARYADAETLDRWRRWKEETIAWSRREGRAAVVVAKESHLMTLFVGGQPVATYAIDLGFNWVADKSRAGDGATPEGRYRVVSKLAASAYYKALLLDYPNAEDRAEFSRARRSGDLPRSAGIGGSIEIHGEGGRGRDWTKGCVAVTNTDMDALYARVNVGTPVTIVGSDDFGSISELAAQHRAADGIRGR